MDDSDDEGRLGDLIVAAFDEAAHFSADPVEVSKLATRAVTHILERTRRSSAASLEQIALDRPLSPAGRRATAVVLRLIPGDGPKFRLRKPSPLRLVGRPPSLRLCPEPEPPQSPESGGDASSRTRPRRK